MKTVKAAVFQRTFPDGRVRNVWAIGYDDLGVLHTFTKVNGPRMVVTTPKDDQFENLIQEHVNQGYQPLGMYEVKDAVLGVYLEAIDNAILAKCIPRKLENTTPNLYFACDGLSAGWSKDAAEVAGKVLVDVTYGPDWVSFAGVTIRTDAKGKAQGNVPEGAGLLGTLTMMAIAKCIAGISLADAAGGEVKPADLESTAAHLMKLGATQDEIDEHADRLGIRRNIKKLLQTVNGGLPILSF